MSISSIDTEALEHSPSVLGFAIATAIAVLQGGASEAAAPEVDLSTLAEEAAPDAFLAHPLPGPIDLAHEETAPELELGYFLYHFGPEDNTAYWLSGQRIDDEGYSRLVAGGEALYAKFGLLGMYQDMDIAYGYGGIRPIEQADMLRFMDPADL
jgi:hypothetical protein